MPEIMQLWKQKAAGSLQRRLVPVQHMELGGGCTAGSVLPEALCPHQPLRACLKVDQEELRLEAPLEVIQSSSCSAGKDHAQHHVQMGFEHLQRRRLLNLSGLRNNKVLSGV